MLALGADGVDSCPKADSPLHPENQGARAFIDGGRRLHAQTTVSSDSHLEIGLRWSDQCCLDCFRYS